MLFDTIISRCKKAPEQFNALTNSRKLKFLIYNKTFKPHPSDSILYIIM